MRKRNEGIIASFIVTFVSLYLVSLIFPKIYFDNTLSIIVAGIIFGIVNATIKPVFVFFSLPLVFLTFGLFMFIINGLMFIIVSKLVPGFHVESFWDAVFASILLSFLNNLIRSVFFD